MGRLNTASLVLDSPDMSSEVRAVLCGTDPKRRRPECDHDENSDRIKWRNRLQGKVTVQET